MTQPLCADCRTRPAVLKRGKESVCVDCYTETPLQPLAQWDRVINPAFILALEKRIDALEKLIAEGTADS